MECSDVWFPTSTLESHKLLQQVNTTVEASGAWSEKFSTLFKNLKHQQLRIIPDVSECSPAFHLTCQGWLLLVASQWWPQGLLENFMSRHKHTNSHWVAPSENPWFCALQLWKGRRPWSLGRGPWNGDLVKWGWSGGGRGKDPASALLCTDALSPCYLPPFLQRHLPQSRFNRQKLSPLRIC